MRSENAVIELRPLAPGLTEEQLLEAFESFGWDFSHVVLHNGVRWVPESCTPKSYGCEFDVVTLKTTLNKPA